MRLSLICTYKRGIYITYLEGIMVILLVLLTGVGSLLAAPDGSLLLLELSAATLLLVAVEFLRGTGFRFGFTGTVS
jgi:hypothetical protein